MTDRHFAPTPRQRHHKRLARKLVERVGGVEAAALFCRLGKSQLSDCQNPNVAAFLPGDVIEELEAVAGEPVYTAGLADMADHVLLPKLDAGEDSDGLASSVIALTDELGDVAREIRSALRDRKVEPPEARRALEQLAELERASAALRRKLQRLAEPDEGVRPLREVG
jgi:hypothetical protein